MREEEDGWGNEGKKKKTQSRRWKARKDTWIQNKNRKHRKKMPNHNILKASQQPGRLHDRLRDANLRHRDANFQKKKNSISSLLHPRWCISGAVPLTPTVSVWCSPGCGHQRAPHFINLSWVVGATRGTGRDVNSIGRFSVWVAPSMLLVAAVPFPAAIRITAGLHCQTWLRGFFLLQHVLHYPPQNKWATQDHCDKQTNEQTNKHTHRAASVPPGM